MLWTVAVAGVVYTQAMGNYDIPVLASNFGLEVLLDPVVYSVNVPNVKRWEGVRTVKSGREQAYPGVIAHKAHFQAIHYHLVYDVIFQELIRGKITPYIDESRKTASC